MSKASKSSTEGKKHQKRSKSSKADKEGELMPDINSKVDEFFIRWFNLPGTQKSLKEGLKKIRSNNKETRSTSHRKDEKRDAVDAGDEATKCADVATTHPPSQTASPPTAPPILDKPILSPRRRPLPQKRQGSREFKFPTKNEDVDSAAAIDSVKQTTETIPRFYFPAGEPRSPSETKAVCHRISKAFGEAGKDRLTRRELGSIAQACGVSSYWKGVIFKAAAATRDVSTVAKHDVTSMWNRIAQSNHDPASRFVAMLAKPGNSHLEFDDFLCLMQDIVETHPGLVFLREAPEFHTRYMNTVVARIFYVINRSWSGQISVPELRRSNLLEVLDQLADETDINAVTDYFSYEHFYVVYCKFWELDTDHDLVVDRLDLSRHASGALPMRLVDRLLCGAVTRWDSSDARVGKMSYIDFVWFLISEEDKTSATSIEYWFRCMDLDGDGIISMYEMEYFYEEQVRKLEQLDIEPLPFEDCVCQMLDMVKPTLGDRITLRDLKRCKLAKVFFDTFFNVEKYLDHEQKDPFAPQGKDGDGCGLAEPSDWEKYAAEEYEMLVAEEHASEQQMSLDLSYGDVETDRLIDDELRNLGLVAGNNHVMTASSSSPQLIGSQQFDSSSVTSSQSSRGVTT